MPGIASLTSAVLIAAFFLVLFRSRRSNRKLPPGPPGLPLIGNLLDIPKKQPWVVYRDWARKYGTHAALRYLTLL